jgi:hypothetical protein
MTVPFGDFSFQVWFRSGLPSKSAFEYGRIRRRQRPERFVSLAITLSEC